MKKSRIPFVQTRRDAWVEINLGNIEHNIRELKNLQDKNCNFLAVVKADAYGHDATMVTPTLVASGVDMLGVASVDEGLQLRLAGITAPILVLGTAPGWAFVSAVENDIQLSIFTEEHLKACVDTYSKLKKKPKAHIKVDTGMHRIGISFEEAPDFINSVKTTEEIDLQGVFTHLACAEDKAVSHKQIQNWQTVLNKVDTTGLIVHMLSTSGLIGYPDQKYDMVRAGIGIYGLMPNVHDEVQTFPHLKQVMGLKGRIVYLKELPPDRGISYGYSFKTKNEKTRIATIPIGYADGVSRALSNKIYGILNGQKVKQVGNITMDQMMFDISDIENPNIGDVITILGEDGKEVILIDEWAKILNTINYEITCHLKVRLPRVYTRN